MIDLPANFEPNRKLNDILQDKRLVFQDKPKITSTKRKFLKDLNMVSPDYTIYCHNGYIKRFNQKENVHHYYNGVLRKHKEYSEKIDMILDDSQSEMFVPELDNNIYLNDSKDLYQEMDINDFDVYRLGAVIGSYAGPNGIVLAFFANNK